MHFFQPIALILIFVILFFDICESDDCSNPLKTITVSQSGKENFKTIQSAIDSVPAGNSQWIHIQISSGVYKEQIYIPENKPCIYLEGVSRQTTSIEWSIHENATFDTRANNTVLKGITIANTLNNPVVEANGITQGVAARIHADKCVFYSCGFLGVQDTLFSDIGRHYFKQCFIQGGVDFIYGNGQSIFEDSNIYFSMGKNGPKSEGVITAHYRNSSNDPSGFVFNRCKISGSSGGKFQLGRSMKPYARVIIANSFLSDGVKPEGWSPRLCVGQEAKITFVEEKCSGDGSNKSQRVKWMKSLSEAELNKFLSPSFIDQEGWISKLPTNIFN
ncbi:probable pectinesterase 55 [Vicia villosa]|uniref:probable pectinesterase 55 n=1 Tax=Vicia villosa TaxID=3911 RepID=UPI00273B5358|nr:probable pectinesterase 55 [Vicia villosa]